MAGYRAKYGGSLLRKVPEQVEKQETYEKEQSTKHEIAKKKRAEEKARLDEIQVRCLAPVDNVGLTFLFHCSANVLKLREHVLQRRRLFGNANVRKQEAGGRKSDNKRKRKVSRSRKGQKVEQDHERTKSLLVAGMRRNANLAANPRRRLSAVRMTR
jgi:hypothetical protein